MPRAGGSSSLSHWRRTSATTRPSRSSTGRASSSPARPRTMPRAPRSWRPAVGSTTPSPPSRTPCATPRARACFDSISARCSSRAETSKVPPGPLGRLVEETPGLRGRASQLRRGTRTDRSKRRRHRGLPPRPRATPGLERGAQQPGLRARRSRRDRRGARGLPPRPGRRSLPGADQLQPRRYAPGRRARRSRPDLLPDRPRARPRATPRRARTSRSRGASCRALNPRESRPSPRPHHRPGR